MDGVTERYDMIGAYREAGLWVSAAHCPGCGRWAHIVSGDEGGGGAYWLITDCKKCGKYERTGRPVGSPWANGTTQKLESTP